MSVENPKVPPEDGSEDERPMTPEELEILASVYKKGRIVPKDDLTEAPIRMLLDKAGNQMYDEEGEPLLNISDAESARQAKVIRDLFAVGRTPIQLAEFEKRMREKAHESIRAREIGQAAIWRAKKKGNS
jgi:hypothetical protein